MATKIKKTVKKYNDNLYEVTIVKTETNETVTAFGKTEQYATEKAFEKLIQKRDE